MPTTMTATALGGGDFRIQITDTNGDDTTEGSVAGMPAVGWVERQVLVKTGGPALSVQPVLGWVTNPHGTDSVICEDDGDDEIADNQGVASYNVPDASRAADGTVTLFHRSNYSNGNTNTGSGWYILHAGSPPP